MKRFTAVLIAIVIACGFVGFGVARAAGTSSVAEVPRDATFTGTYIRSAERITIDGTVNGDVLVAGSEVTINGTVNGSIYVAGSKVRVTGPIKGNVHIAASDITYTGQTTGSVFLAGSKVTTESSARAGSGFMAGSDVQAGGEFDGSLYAAGSQVAVSAKVSQDVTLAGSQITLNNQAQVGGNLKYASSQEAKIDNDRVVSGSISRISTPQPSAADRFKARLGETLYWLVANLLLAAAILRFAPKLLLPAEESFMQQPLNNVMKATVFVIFVPVAIVFGLFTIIGIPLMLLLGLIYVLVLVLAPTAAAHWLGRLIWSSQTKASKPKSSLKLSYGQEVAAAGIGLLLVAIIGLVPVVGGIVSLALFLIGLGILLSRGITPLGGQLSSPQASKKA